MRTAIRILCLVIILTGCRGAGIKEETVPVEAAGTPVEEPEAQEAGRGDKPDKQAAREAEKIKELIELLGHREYRERERAGAELLKVGVPAIRFLKEALHCGDAEIEERSKKLIPAIQAKVSHNLRILEELVEFNRLDVIKEFAARDMVDLSAGNAQGYTLLHQAVKFNKKEIASYFVEKGVPVDAQAADGFTALHLGAEAGHKEMVELLVSRKAEVNIPDDKGLTALDLAVRNYKWDAHKILLKHGGKYGDPGYKLFEYAAGRKPLTAEMLDNIKKLLDEGCDPNIEDCNGYTPLLPAVLHNHKELVKLLITAGAYITAENEKEIGPLHWAASSEIAQIFIDNEAGVDDGDYYGYTPLHHAVYGGRGDVAELLIEKGADINAANEYSKTSLHTAIDAGRKDMVELLLDKGADINAGRIEEKKESGTGGTIDLGNGESYGATPLHLAAEEGKLEIVRLLIDRGADIRAKGENGKTLLHSAVQGECFELVKDLLEKKFDVKDSDAETPLHYARSSEMAELLVAAGADVDPETYRSPLLCSSVEHSSELVKFLLEKGAKINRRSYSYSGGDVPFRSAVYHGNIDTVKLLIDSGADIHPRQERFMLWGWNLPDTPLHIAVCNGYREIVELLLERGANIDMAGSLPTPLHEAAQYGEAGIARILIDKGARLEAKADYGDTLEKDCINGATPLHMAVYMNKWQVAEVFIEKGADVNARDSENRTPLYIAAEEGYAYLCHILIEAGADLEVKGDWDESTPLHSAARGKDVEIVKLLIARGADLNSGNNSGETPLYTAMHYDRPEIATVLEQMGAKIKPVSHPEKPESQGEYERLRGAAVSGDIELVRQLIRGGADVNARDKHDQTVLGAVASWGGAQAKQIIELLIKHGARVNADCYPDGSALEQAMARERKDIVELLKKHGARKGDIYDKDISAAVGSNDITALKKLEEKGIVTDASSKLKANLLLRAAKSGAADAARILVSCGADANAKEDYGSDRALHLAVKNSHLEIVELLISKGANVNERGWSDETPLHKAAEKGQKEIVKALIAAGANVNAKNEYGQTPLHETRSTEVAGLLIEKGADLNARSKYGSTPLHGAVSWGRKELAALLIKSGADINLPDGMFGLRPLHVAAQGSTELIGLLLESGADIEGRDIDDNTPLHLASAGGYKETVELLIEKGADITARNRCGWTPLDWAVNYRQKEIAELLRMHSEKPEKQK